MNPTRLGALAALAVALVAVAATLTGDTLQIVDSAWRIVPAGLAVMLLPGLAFGECVGFRAESAFEAIAKAFAISLIFAVALALFVLSMGLPIIAWTGVILAWDIAWGLPLLLGRGSRSGLVTVLARSLATRDGWGDKALLGVLILLAVGFYRMADSVDRVGWETGLLVAYARHAASNLPLDFATINLRPDIKLHNIFLAWQFMLGGVAKIAGVDPLIAALRSRWTIPLLGLSSFFFFVQHLIGSIDRARLVTWCTLVLVVTHFFALDPSPLVRAGVEDRPLFAFLGSVHHADVGLDVLLPLLGGFLFLFLRTGRTSDLAMLAVLLVASFFFHPREYFQVMWYGVILAIANALVAGRQFSGLWPGKAPAYEAAGHDTQGMALRYLFLFATFVLVAGLLLLISHLFEGGGSQSSEFSQKRVLLTELWAPLKLLSAESFMNFNIHYYGGAAPNPPNVYSWLALTALMLPVIAIAGDQVDRKVALILIVLWWLTVCFALSQHVLLLLTYSQILTSKVRFLPLFAYTVIGVGWGLLTNLVINLWPTAIQKFRWIATLAVFAVAGAIFAVIWRLEAPSFSLLRPVLSGLVMTSGAIILLRAYAPRWWQRRLPDVLHSDQAAPQPALALSVVGLLAFTLPVSATATERFVHALVGPSRALTDLFTDNNPTGLSQRTIAFLRNEVPPRSHVQVDPLSNHLVAIYAPLYGVPFPRGQISADYAEIEERRTDKHPLFSNAVRNGTFDLPRITAHLKRKQIDYVLGSRAFFTGFSQLAAAHPDRFEIVFADRASGDIVLRIR